MIIQVLTVIYWHMIVFFLEVGMLGLNLNVYNNREIL